MGLELVPWGFLFLKSEVEIFVSQFKHPRESFCTLFVFMCYFCFKTLEKVLIEACEQSKNY